MNKKVFKTKDEDVEVELAVVRPSPEQTIESQLVYNREWANAEKKGNILRRNLDEVAERHGLWDEDKRKRVNKLEEEIVATERKLRGGANNYDNVEKAKSDALKIKSLREERLTLLQARNSLDQFTAENFADTARLQYLVSKCVVDNTSGKLYFKSFDDYMAKSNETIGLDAFTNYLEMIYSDFPSDSGQLYENQFLLKHGFVNEKFKLVDKRGRLIDEEGRLIREDGRYINEFEELVDRDGNKVDEAGNYLIEFKEFEDSKEFY